MQLSTTNLSATTVAGSRSGSNWKTQTLIYWISTAILTFVLLSGGVAELARWGETVSGVVQLGYPAYFVTIIGIWKVLGGIAILVPGFARLKEWAYAGAFFDLTGAVISHVVCGDKPGHIVTVSVLAVVVLVSWAFRPEGRVRGSILPVKKDSFASVSK